VVGTNFRRFRWFRRYGIGISKANFDGSSTGANVVGPSINQIASISIGRRSGKISENLSDISRWQRGL